MPKVCQRFSLPHKWYFSIRPRYFFVHYSIANPGVNCANSSGSAFMGYIPSPPTTHTDYLIVYYT